MKRLFLLAAALMFLGSVAMAQDQGTISGTIWGVQNNDTIPLAGANVTAFHPDAEHPSASVWTDSLGQYTLHVDFGFYKVRAGAMNFMSEWFDNVRERSQATILHVTADSSWSGINFVLIHEQLNAGQISGRIFESGTDHDIGNAMVTATRQGPDTLVLVTHSDDDGDYDFEHVPAGAFVVMAQKEGWIEGIFPDTLMVNNNEFDHVNIGLTRIPPAPPHTISGIVTNGLTGAPLRGAHVTARGHDWDHFGGAETDSLGAYTIANLQPDTYTISASKEDFFRGQFPQPVVLDTADVTGINIALFPRSGLGISGRVFKASDSTGIDEAIIVAIDVAHPDMERHAESREDGTYRISAPPGEYIVEATAEGFIRQEFPTHVIVTDTVVTGVDFALVAVEFGSIAGTVTDTAGAPIVGANVEARKFGGHNHRHARTDSTGAYIIRHVYPGEYRVTAFHRGFAPGMFPDTVVVANGQDVTGINIVLQSMLPPFNGTMAGVVTNDSTHAAIEHAFVMAIGQVSDHGHMRHIFRYTFTDSLGAYIFDNLPVIAFKLFAAAQGYMGEFYNDVHHYSDATPVTPNATGIDFALHALPMGVRALAGHIDAASGYNPEGSIIYATLNGQIANIVACDPNGDFGFDEIPAGIYEVSVVNPEGDGQLNNPVNLTFGDAYVEIQLNPTAANDNAPALPTQATLGQNYPNPFNAQTLISFELVNPGDIELSVFNLVGQKVTTLLSGNYQSGTYNVIWNGRAQNGEPVSSGVYYYRLRSGNDTQTMKMTLLK